MLSVISSASAVGGDAVRVEQLRDVDRQRGVEQVAGRQVDGDARARARVAARRAHWRSARVEHAARERPDQAGLLGERDELVRARAGRRCGWFQRTSASTPTMRAVVEVDLRLVVRRRARRARAPRRSSPTSARRLGA